MLGRRSESIRMETRKGGEAKLKKKVKGNSTDYHERSEGIPSDWIP